MFKLFKLAILATLLGGPVLAADYENASSIVSLKLQRLEEDARVLKRNQGERSERILVAIPAQVMLADGCTHFVGQQVHNVGIGWMRIASSIHALGTKDATADVCTAVAPDPLRVNLVVEFKVKADHRGAVSQMVWIGSHLFRVTLNGSRDGVKVTKLVR